MRLNKKKCFFLFFTLSSAIAQDKLYSSRNGPLSSENVITSIAIHFSGLYVYQERKLVHHTTLMYGAGIYFSSYVNSDPPEPLKMRKRFVVVTDNAFSSFYEVSSVTPYLFMEIRQYFSWKRRVQKEKDVKNNAANYIGLFVEAPLAAGRMTETTSISMAYPVGIKIGMRRNIGGNFYFDGSLGFLRKLHSAKINTARIDETTTNYTPRLKIDFGYVF